MSLARWYVVVVAVVSAWAGTPVAGEDVPLLRDVEESLLISDPSERASPVTLVSASDYGGGDCAAECFGDGCETGCDCDGGPCWVLRGGAIFLQRSTPSGVVLVNSPTGPLLNAHDFGFSARAGFDVGAIRQLNDDWSVDVRYFQVDGWNEALGPVATAVSTVSYQGANSSVVLADPHGVNAAYGSLLRSAEVNARRQTREWLTLLAGFRYINLQESLTVAQDVFFFHGVETRNNLYGAQVGLEALVWSRGRARIESWAKVGLYGNDAHSNYTFLFPAIPDANFNSALERGQTSFVGDLGFVGAYRLTDHLLVRGGYQLLWIDGVALASDQFKTSSAAGTNIGIGSTGGVFYHGALVGLEFTW